MANSKIEDDWNRTSLIACILANANRDPKKKSSPYTIKDFHPMLANKKIKPVEDTKFAMNMLKSMFCKDELKIVKKERIIPSL